MGVELAVKCVMRPTVQCQQGICYCVNIGCEDAASMPRNANTYIRHCLFVQERLFPPHERSGTSGSSDVTAASLCF